MRLAILSFACGVLFLQSQAELPELWLLGLLGTVGIVAVAGGGAGVCGKKGWLRHVSLLVACAMLGFVWAGAAARWRLAEQLPLEWETRPVVVTGVIASLPQRFERGERFEFDVEAVHTAGAAVPSRVMLSWYRSWDDVDEVGETDEARMVRPGERWRFTVKLKRPHGNANPHGFDYEAWLFERGIRATGTIRAREEVQRLDQFVLTPRYALERLRGVMRDRFLRTFPDAPYLGVLTALSVGDQRSIPAEQWQVFNRTGVTHLVSISGLHVTMVAALFAALVNFLWRRSVRLMLRLPAQKAAVLAGWLAAFAYALLAGFEVPAQRTLYMLSVVALALLSGRHFGASRTLLLALLVVLVLDPMAILATGFWLSFGAVAILFLVGTARIGEARGWRAALARWGTAQWAVTIGSVPLLLFFFQQFSLVSPLANALAIPFVSLVVTPLALIFGVLPWPPLLQFDHWLLAQLMKLLEWLAAYPVWQQPAPPIWASLLAVAGVVWLLMPRGFPSRWIGVIPLLPALFWVAPRPAAGEAWVNVLDVGQGSAVLVRTAEHTLLYDAGPVYSAQADAGQRVIVPYLRATGVGRLDAMVISHRDKDHSGGVSAVQAALPIVRTVSSIPELGGESCVAGQHWAWDGVRFDILHPQSADYGTEEASPAARMTKTNSMSCVLKVSTEKRSVLLTGDIAARDEKAIVERSGSLLGSDVLLVPHHGARASSSPGFIAAVGARDVVFSAGYRNAFNHPRQEVLERYAASRQWRTDRDGAIRIVLTDTSEVSAWRTERRRYWNSQ
ncbi:MAG: DNA internalization-related competence protein ComEC/Rec2 [Propionivibrio sp.]